MKQNFHTAQDIVERLRAADAAELATLERSLAADTRKTVQRALASARRRIEAERAERERVEGMYSFQDELASGKLLVGLDEVGRGPLAGPLTVGAVVLPKEPIIYGLNDSKQLTPQRREELAAQIKEQALAWSIQYIQPHDIDENGMTASLRSAFSAAIREIEEAGVDLQVVLLDGNALHLDSREINVVKGDARCASISAASIIAKVERDALMVEYAKEFPEYGFDGNKGYGSAAHIEAIKQYGLSPIHRASFCTAFVQDKLF
ncbi:ribonuclease HII [Denitrobacterium detoxificans]|uniref:ribonuclease HII n=1 Tax=Denitrobacterium detoxificans TaxID=79604 RepID=UPI0026F01A2B|nr:ribonuclease HII [Denitrobacterium detoxificans]MBE6465193.1 ribonuclease HII [Denitrobacterium detoxificans]